MGSMQGNSPTVIGGHQTSFTMGNSQHSPQGPVNAKNVYGKVQSTRPAARDGHSGIIH